MHETKEGENVGRVGGLGVPLSNMGRMTFYSDL